MAALLPATSAPTYRRPAPPRAASGRPVRATEARRAGAAPPRVPATHRRPAAVPAAGVDTPGASLRNIVVAVDESEVRGGARAGAGVMRGARRPLAPLGGPVPVPVRIGEADWGRLRAIAPAPRARPSPPARPVTTPNPTSLRPPIPGRHPGRRLGGGAPVPRRRRAPHPARRSFAFPPRHPLWRALLCAAAPRVCGGRPGGSGYRIHRVALFGRRKVGRPPARLRPLRHRARVRVGAVRRGDNHHGGGRARRGGCRPVGALAVARPGVCLGLRLEVRGLAYDAPGRAGALMLSGAPSRSTRPRARRARSCWCIDAREGEGWERERARRVESRRVTRFSPHSRAAASRSGRPLLGAAPRPRAAGRAPRPECGAAARAQASPPAPPRPPSPSCAAT